MQKGKDKQEAWQNAKQMYYSYQQIYSLIER